MVELGFVVPTGLMVLVTFLFLRRVEDSRTASDWAWGWIALYVAGIALSLSKIWPSLIVVSTLGLSLFAGFDLSGALAFAGREKRWVIPLAVGLGVVRLVFWFAGQQGMAYLLALPMVVPMAAAAAVVVWRATATRSVTAPDRLLAPVLAVNAVLTGAAPMVNFFGYDNLILVVTWANVAVLLAFLQLMALEERRRQTQTPLAHGRAPSAQQGEGGPAVDRSDSLGRQPAPGRGNRRPVREARPRDARFIGGQLCKRIDEERRRCCSRNPSRRADSLAGTHRGPWVDGYGTAHRRPFALQAS